MSAEVVSARVVVVTEVVAAAEVVVVVEAVVVAEVMVVAEVVVVADAVVVAEAVVAAEVVTIFLWSFSAVQAERHRLMIRSRRIIRLLFPPFGVCSIVFPP